MIQNSIDFNHTPCRGYLRADDVDAAIWNAITQILRCPDLILEQYRNQEARELEDSQTTHDYLRYCDEQVHRLELQRNKVLDLYLNDRIPPTLLDEKLLDIDQRLKTHREKLHELQERLTQIHTVPGNYEELVLTFCETVQAGIDNFTDEEKRSVVELLDIHVYVERGETRDDTVYELTGFIPTVRIPCTFLVQSGNNL